ncbi:InlB B-repeat-containing protein, partial [Desulfonatronum thioautotrophicum]|uniref:InlB B-repeat-containing protein n=1 Tax=Desulfonatronum thioautotrophicum TaxID=617001 RepID=UPI001ABF4E9F
MSHGGTTVFTVTPEEGYTATVGGTCGGDLDDTTFTTNPITEDCTVVASFTLNTYTVTPSAGDIGSIDPNEVQTVSHGDTAIFTVTSDESYTATVGGTCGGNLVGDTFTTDPITSDCSVEVAFSLYTYTVIPSVGDNGTIPPTESQSVRHGGNLVYTVNPDEGYSASVSGTCGGNLVGDTYTTDPITSDCTVNFSFTEQPVYFGSLTVHSTGALNVPITANSPEYNGTSTYTTANIPTGTEITLTAPAIADSTFFSSWSGCDSTSHADRACTVSVKDDATVTAHYFTDLRKMLEYDESYYLAAYDDIRDAVDRGLLPSGFEHYIHSGRFENRRPNALFDPHYYMARYPDIGQAIAGGMYPGTAFDHFVASGLW